MALVQILAKGFTHDKQVFFVVKKVEHLEDVHMVHLQPPGPTTVDVLEQFNLVQALVKIIFAISALDNLDAPRHRCVGVNALNRFAEGTLAQKFDNPIPPNDELVRDCGKLRGCLETGLAWLVVESDRHARPRILCRGYLYRAPRKIHRPQSTPKPR